MTLPIPSTMYISISVIISCSATRPKPKYKRSEVTTVARDATIPSRAFSAAWRTLHPTASVPQAVVGLPPPATRVGLPPCHNVFSTIPASVMMPEGVSGTVAAPAGVPNCEAARNFCPIDSNCCGI